MNVKKSRVYDYSSFEKLSIKLENYVLYSFKMNIKRNFIKNTRAMLYQWESEKNKYLYILFNSNISEQKIRNLFNKCSFKIFFKKTEFQNYNKLSEEDKNTLIEKYITTTLDDKKKNIYFRIASELSLYDVETKMHKKLYEIEVDVVNKTSELEEAIKNLPTI